MRFEQRERKRNNQRGRAINEKGHRERYIHVGKEREREREREKTHTHS
jgi:hypothetical protein